MLNIILCISLKFSLGEHVIRYKLHKINILNSKQSITRDDHQRNRDYCKLHSFGFVVKVYPVTHNSFPNLLLYHAITTFLFTCENVMLRARTEATVCV